MTSIALARVLSTQISTFAKISAPADQKQPHRLAVQVDVNDPCVYRKLKSERSDGEASRGLGVNESFRPDESDEKSAHPCAETDVF